MQKCFYHPPNDAATTCIGCKMPVCQGCRDEGKNGFCGQCFKKVSSLGAQVADTKKTGMVSANQKATMVKHMGRPTGPMNVTYCFHHFDVVASGTCATCTRSFCPACLTSTGICTHCAKLGETPKGPRKGPEGSDPLRGPLPAERPAPQPRPRPAAPAASAAVAVAAKGQDKTKVILISVIVVLAAVLVMVLLKR
jgi:hypothetical protein